MLLGDRIVGPIILSIQLYYYLRCPNFLLLFSCGLSPPPHISFPLYCGGSRGGEETTIKAPEAISSSPLLHLRQNKCLLPLPLLAHSIPDYTSQYVWLLINLLPAISCLAWSLQKRRGSTTVKKMLILRSVLYGRNSNRQCKIVKQSDIFQHDFFF